MKKQIIASLTCFLFCMALVSAFALPYNVAVVVEQNGENLVGVQGEVCFNAWLDVNNNPECVDFRTNDNGEYVFADLNLYSNSEEGDVITIKIGSIERDITVKQGGEVVTIDVSNEDNLNIIIPPTNVPTPNTCEMCAEGEECPNVDNNGLLAALIAGLSCAVIGTGAGMYFTRNKTWGVNNGVKIYRNRKGEEVVQHKHPGIKGYHNPTVSHRDIKEKHPKGQMNPNYAKDETGAYKYVK